MKKFFRLKRNGIVVAESELLVSVKQEAEKMERTFLSWRDFSDQNEFYECAVTEGDVLTRNEYEIVTFRKRV